MFLLDADGFCRGITSATRDPEVLGRVRDIAAQCIGAQYVASIDMTAPGALVDLPLPGAQLVFAVVSAEGRVALVRTAPILSVQTVADPVPPPIAPPVTIAPVGPVTIAPIVLLREPPTIRLADFDGEDDHATLLRGRYVPQAAPSGSIEIDLENDS
jgi:hypothetical protein